MMPAEKLVVVEWRPTVAGQEHDTRATTGVIYWEGFAARLGDACRIRPPG